MQTQCTNKHTHLHCSLAATLSLTAPLSSFHPPQPFLQCLQPKPSRSPFPFSNQAQFPKEEKQPFPPQYPLGESCGKAENLKLDLCDRQEACRSGGNCWEPHGVFVFWLPQPSQTQSRGSGSESY